MGNTTLWWLFDTRFHFTLWYSTLCTHKCCFGNRKFWNSFLRFNLPFPFKQFNVRENRFKKSKPKIWKLIYVRL